MSFISKSTALDLAGTTHAAANLTLMEIARSTNIEQALTSPKVFQVKKSLGEQGLHKLVVFVLKNFNDNSGIKEPMNTVQLIETAYAFIDTYTHASVDDLILCLKNAKAGKYGPLYNRLDQMTIMGFYAKYEAEKSQYLEAKQLDHKAREASDVMGIFKHLPEETRQRLMHKSPESLIVEEGTTPLFDETEYKAVITEWMRTASVEDLEGGISYYKGKGSKEYITLLEKELLSRTA